MDRFIIVDGLPYLYAGGKAYAVKWDSAGFTVGAEKRLRSVPAVTYNELSIKAKCAADLDSIKAEPEKKKLEPEKQQEQGTPAVKPKRTSRKKGDTK